MKQLVEAAQAGDLEAFSQLVSLYQERVYAVAYAVLGDFHLAQDVAQDTFVAAWRDVKKLEPPEKFPVWLGAIARNRSIDVLRRRVRDRRRLQDVQPQLTDEARSTNSLWGQDEELKEVVAATLATLSEPNRLATTLYYMVGHDVATVAEFLGVPLGTVKRRLHDSRRRLRDRVLADFEGLLKQHGLAIDFGGRTMNKIGVYTVLGGVAIGGTSTLHVAHPPTVDRKLAIRVPWLPEDAEARKHRRRWWQEQGPRVASLLRRLDHPNVVRLADVVEQDDLPYLVYEFIEGQSWGQALAQGQTFTPSDVIGPMLTVADALHHCHERRVIHRDVKPDNIMITPSGEAMLVGFTLAVPGPGDSDYDVPRSDAGTLCYMAPEHVRKEAATVQNDVWSFGATIFRLLTGRFVYALDFESSRAAVAERIASADPVDLDRLERVASPALCAVVGRCLRKDPQERFGNAKQLAEALRGCR